VRLKKTLLIWDRHNCGKEKKKKLSNWRRSQLSIHLLGLKMTIHCTNLSKVLLMKVANKYFKIKIKSFSNCRLESYFLYAADVVFPQILNGVSANFVDFSLEETMVEYQPATISYRSV